MEFVVMAEATTTANNDNNDNNEQQHFISSTMKNSNNNSDGSSSSSSSSSQRTSNTDSGSSSSSSSSSNRNQSLTTTNSSSSNRRSRWRRGSLVIGTIIVLLIVIPSRYENERNKDLMASLMLSSRQISSSSSSFYQTMLADDGNSNSNNNSNSNSINNTSNIINSNNIYDVANIKQPQQQQRYQQQQEEEEVHDKDNNDNNDDDDIVNVLFGLSGNNPGFLSEFEVALKSVLLNAPIDRKLNIYVMADKKAYNSLDTIFHRTGLKVPSNNNHTNTNTTTTTTWITRNPITINTFDVSSYIPQWKQQIQTVLNFTLPGPANSNKTAYDDHTIGCFFRLFAHTVPEISGVHHLLYMDTDVVLMANLDALWNFIPTSSNTAAAAAADEQHQQPIFQWGAKQCSGFVLLNVHKMDLLWELAPLAPLYNISKRDFHLSDQTLFQGINETYPQYVGLLPDGWDMTVTEKWRPKYQPYDQKLPNVGMLHLNGGASSKEAYWKNPKDSNNFITTFPETWGMAKYYADIPWTWSRYQAHTLIRIGHNGYQLQIIHEGTTIANANANAEAEANSKTTENNKKRKRKKKKMTTKKKFLMEQQQKRNSTTPHHTTQ